MYEPEEKKGGKGKDAKPRGGAFAIVSKLLAYPVEKEIIRECRIYQRAQGVGR